MIFKNITKLNAAFGAGFLAVVMTLSPATCRAQAEINPDHYDTTDVSAVGIKANPHRSDSRHAFRQEPSAGVPKPNSKKLAPKRKPVQLSAKTTSANRSRSVR